MGVERTQRGHAAMAESDPNVWSGRALQAGARPDHPINGHRDDPSSSSVLCESVRCCSGAGHAARIQGIIGEPQIQGDEALIVPRGA